MNIQNLVLDINKKTFQTITANVGEVASRFVRINIVDKSIPVDLTGVIVSLYAKKPDGNTVFNNVTIEDKTNGVILAELTSQILVVEGLVKLTLLLVKDNAKLCSKQFLLNVDSSIVDDDAIESSNEFGALTESLSKVSEWNNYFEETSGKIEEKYTERLNDVSSQLEQNGIEIEKINKQLKLNVLDFGAVADGITDNTKVFQDIIDSIETFRIKTYFTPSTMTGKGAVIFIPSGKYLIKGSLKFKGGITFKGEGFSSVIIHRPVLESNLFESDYISNATWNNNILNVVWEDLSIEGDYDSLTDTGKSLVGINLNQCGLTRINRCFIGYFKTGIFNACNSNYEGGYYNVLTNSSVRACKLALDLNTDQYTVSDTNITPSASNIAADYCVKACGGGISFSNCAIEGNVNKALYYIGGPGVSIQGGYSEANRGRSCFAEIDISKLQYGGVEINNLFTNPSIKFINLYNSTDFTPSYPMSTGIRINSKGEYMPNVVKNGCFVDDSSWGKNQAPFFNGEVINEGQMFSSTSYKMTKITGTSSCSMRQGVKIATPNAFVTCVVKKSDNAVPFLAVFDSTNVLKNMVRLADYDNGWELYGVWIPAKSKDTTYTIALGLAGTSPVGSTIEFTNVGVYNNGIDYFPTN